ncbi:TIGR03757 family integrating conjugative element protein [Salmonella enterica]|uniref:TIGR03757 family integrating conjugative element protein n=3 Tax=Salmonella enterica TaxID=28901 RepID=A0A3R0CAF0_SALER|nr:TIGR03757 family integrating conjugative element protein [Salmonella enterica]EBY9434072.1 TIGR03757 family integrating conjugative element protein [Salmonella enterica subsp. enterica serovar Cerro]PTU39089.1 TIGR03757 family integrating conjugative element protein [Salmonella enterica subsp. enterica]EAO9251645.1 TIGR03757 family integrating conjugative element protein [Salmonella enterica]EAY4783954.1 TIGR03757 family integrating conjugative element protein [Salmonella enterica]
MVVYTDHTHPPSGVTGDTRVVWLDAPEQLQQSLFGNLPADSKEAERRAQAVIHSAGWQQKQAELTQAYRGVLQAWSLGLQKYPAVVSDGQYVVYGTADVVVAEGLFHSHRTREGGR